MKHRNVKVGDLFRCHCARGGCICKETVWKVISIHKPNNATIETIIAIDSCGTVYLNFSITDIDLLNNKEIITFVQENFEHFL